MAGVVMRVFIRSAEPLWGMVGRWLKEGMGVGDVDDLDVEFFIESNVLVSGAFGVGLLDSDCWAEGYTLRQRDIPYCSRYAHCPSYFEVTLVDPIGENVRLQTTNPQGLHKAICGKVLA